jgi:hypothetical protein
MIASSKLDLAWLPSSLRSLSPSAEVVVWRICGYLCETQGSSHDRSAWAVSVIHRAKSAEPREKVKRPCTRRRPKVMTTPNRVR